MTARDDSPAAFKAALAELEEQVRAFSEGATPGMIRQSFRKPKAG